MTEPLTLQNLVASAIAAAPDRSGELRAELLRRAAEAEAMKPLCFQGEQPHFLVDVPRFIEKARAMFEYDPETGLLYYRFMRRTALRLEERATWPYGPNGYGRVKLWGMGSSSANVVWLLHHGRWPIGRLRRRDGDARNDRIENLAEAPARAGLMGRQPSRGVARSGPHHWQAYTKIEGVQKNLGRFKTEAEAVAARAAWDRGEDLV